jgi:hypothetical protein
MPTFSAGQRLTAGALQAAFPLTSVKSTTENVTSSTVLQNDDQLLLPVVANTTYLLDGYLFYVAAEAGDLKIAFTAPALADLYWSVIGMTTSGVDVTDASVTAENGSLGTVTRVLGGDGGTWCSARLQGRLIVAATAGSLQLQFAQGTSSATATSLRAGSWIQLTPA